jgi:peptidoglycan hydrolase CwlO-like protein
MKKFTSMLVVTGILLTSISYAADTIRENSSDSEIQRQDAERQTDFSLDIQKAYITQLQHINSDLLYRHTILAGNYYASRLANARMTLSMERGTRIPAYVGEVLGYLSTQRANIDAEIKELEKKKEALRLDVDSFYKGKVPEWLSKEWNEEEKEYTDSFNQIYQTMSELTEKVMH